MPEDSFEDDNKYHAKKNIHLDLIASEKTEDVIYHSGGVCFQIIQNPLAADIPNHNFVILRSL